MKLVIITTSYPINHDGSEAAGAFVHDFIDLLNKQAEVSVIYPVSNDIHLKTSSVNHYPFLVPKLPLSTLKIYHPIDLIRIIKTLFSGAAQVEKTVELVNPDHIFALWVFPSGYWAHRYAHKNNIPYSTWALGSDIWSLGKIPILRSLIKNILINAKYSFADGLQLKNQVESISNKETDFLPSTRILNPPSSKVINNQSPYKVAFLGRWHKNKGIDLLLDSLELLDDSTWKKISSFRIAGGGMLNNLVRDKVELLQARNRPVELFGFLNKEEACDLISWADYLIIPSRVESIPVVYSDALHCNTPMVVMPVGDFPLLFEKHPPGIISKEVSKEGLKESIELILDTSPDIYSNNIKISKKMFDLNEITDNLFKKLKSDTKTNS